MASEYEQCKYVNRYCIQFRDTFFIFESKRHYYLKNINGFAYIEFPNMFYKTNTEELIQIGVSNDMDAEIIFVKDGISISVYYLSCQPELVEYTIKHYEYSTFGKYRTEDLQTIDNIIEITSNRLSYYIHNRIYDSIIVKRHYVYYPIIRSGDEFLIPMIKYKPIFNKICDTDIEFSESEPLLDYEEDFPSDIQIVDIPENNTGSTKLMETNTENTMYSSDSSEEELERKPIIVHPETITKVFNTLCSEDASYDKKVHVIHEYVFNPDVFIDVIEQMIISNKLKYLTTLLDDMDDEGVKRIYTRYMDYINKET